MQRTCLILTAALCGCSLVAGNDEHQKNGISGQPASSSDKIRENMQEAQHYVKNLKEPKEDLDDILYFRDLDMSVLLNQAKEGKKIAQCLNQIKKFYNVETFNRNSLAGADARAAVDRYHELGCSGYIYRLYNMIENQLKHNVNADAESDVLQWASDSLKAGSFPYSVIYYSFSAQKKSELLKKVGKGRKIADIASVLRGTGDDDES